MKDEGWILVIFLSFQPTPKTQVRHELHYLSSDVVLLLVVVLDNSAWTVFPDLDGTALSAADGSCAFALDLYLQPHSLR